MMLLPTSREFKRRLAASEPAYCSLTATDDVCVVVDSVREIATTLDLKVRAFMPDSSSGRALRFERR